MRRKIGDEVAGKLCFENGDDVESRGRIIKIDDTSAIVAHYTIKTYDGRIAGAYEDDLLAYEEAFLDEDLT